MRRNVPITLIACIMASSAILSGCESIVYTPGAVTEHRLQVEEKTFSEQVPASKFDADYVRQLAGFYRTYGEGVVKYSVYYDPRAKKNTALQASQEAARVAALLREAGLNDFAADILPVRDQGEELQVFVTFLSYEAHAPEDCSVMPGFNNTDIDYDEDYKAGCTIETAVSRQVRPKDLKGRAYSDVTDGRRAANIGEIYRSGAPNEPLDGQSASGN